MTDLEELKNLLFGAEKQVLDSITERVQKRETRAVDVADILPEAIRHSHEKNAELVSALRDPVGQCFRHSLRNEPREFADALYPVIGPAIRKSIMNTLRAFAQQINETVEHSLTVKGLKWRFEAWRAGIPFGDYVVQRSLLYRVEQAYLISRENGLLVSHVHHDESRIKDSDAVSAMFTAIQDFIKESFSPDRSGRLETADMGEFTLWAVHGPHALLVCVIRGVPPRSLRAELSAILERIHFRYGESIRDYSGDTTTMPGVDDELLECLGFQALKSAEAGKRRAATPLFVIMLLIVMALAYFGYTRWELRQQQQALADALDATPGLYVAAIEREGATFTVRGLRDPLAPQVAEIAIDAGVAPERVVADLRPYQSLDPEIVLRRARDAIDAPQGVSLTANSGAIVLSGTAPRSWIEATRRNPALRNLGLPLDLERVRPSDVSPLPEEPVDLERVRPSDVSPLPEEPVATLRNDVAGAVEASFYFAEGTTLREPDSIRLSEHAATLRQIVDRAADLGAVVRIDVVGSTDGTGSATANAQLADSRAIRVADVLAANGIGADRINRSISVDSAPSGVVDPELRRVTVRLSLEQPGASAQPAIE